MAEAAVPVDGHADGLLNGLESFWLSEEFCDVVLIAAIDGKRVPAHRVILACASDYFRVMFLSGLRESSEKEILLHEVYGHDLALLVRFCYTGNFQVPTDTAGTFFAAASLLQFDKIIKACAVYLKENLQVDNCLGIAQFARMYSWTELHEMAEFFAMDNYAETCTEDEFYELPYENLKDLIARDELRVENEDVVFNSLMSWVQHNETEREKHLPELLRLIRMTQLTRPTLAHELKKLCRKYKLKHMYENAIEYQMLPQRVQPLQHRERNDDEVLLGICSRFRKRETPCVLRHCTLTNEWKEVAVLPEKRTDFAAALHCNQLFIIGGRNEKQEVLKSVLCLDFASKEWRNLKQLHNARANAVAANYRTDLFILGGSYDKSQRHSQVIETANAGMHMWYTYAALPFDCEICDVVAIDEFMYFLLYTSFDTSFKLMRHGPNRMDWLAIAALDAAYSRIKLAVLQDKMYAICKNAKADELSIECYDAETNAWKQLSKHAAVFDNFDCYIFKQEINIACRALNSAKKYTRHDTPILMYHPPTDKWSSILAYNQPLQFEFILSTKQLRTIINTTTEATTEAT